MNQLWHAVTRLVGRDSVRPRGCPIRDFVSPLFSSCSMSVLIGPRSSALLQQWRCDAPWRVSPIFHLFTRAIFGKNGKPVTTRHRVTVPLQTLFRDQPQTPVPIWIIRMSIVNTGRIGGVLICSLAGRSVCRLIGQPRVLARGRAFTCGGL